MRHAFLVTMLLASTSILPSSAQTDSSGTYDANERRPIAETITSVSITPAQRLKLKPKYPIKTKGNLVVPRDAEPGLFIIKFIDGARVRAFNPRDLNTQSTDPEILRQRLRTLRSAGRRLDAADRAFLAERRLSPSDIPHQMTAVRRILSQAEILGWSPLMSQSIDMLDGLRANTELRTGRRASDLANYYWVQMAKGKAAMPVVKALNGLPVVEEAYLVPKIFDPQDIAPPTPDFSNFQGYLDNDDDGIHARFAWTQPGGKGDLVRIIDIESGWNLAHEDLPEFSPQPLLNQAGNDHGTAVMGVLVALDNGVGVTGIVPNAAAGMVSRFRRTGFGQIVNIADSVLTAAFQLSEGDVILVEAQSSGPRNDLDCTCETGDGTEHSQCGLVPVEYANDVYDAVVAASAAGLIVVEAGANGEADLDHARYRGRFDRHQRDSGALIVAGGRSSSRSRRCSSDHGDRIDLHAWGENVVTAGYGTADETCDDNPTCLGPSQVRVNGDDTNQWYTTFFNGTSAASPIVAGAVVAVQGVQFANNNPPLNWLEMRQLLSSTGTQPDPGHSIGPLPNLEAAITTLAPPAPPAPPDAVYETSIRLGEDVLFASRVAGLSARETQILGGGGDSQAIEGILFAERADRPCYLRIEKSHIAENVRGPRRELDVCGSAGHTSRSERYVPILTAARDTFIRKIAICNSTTRRRPFRMKGIRVSQVRINEDGSLFPIPGEKTKHRTNCDQNWRNASECPTGSVAVRFEMHLRPDGDDQSISGIRLICRPVEAVRTCVENC